MKKLVVVQGHMGSGKTTLVEGLTSTLKGTEFEPLVISHANRNRELLLSESKGLRGNSKPIIIDGIYDWDEKIGLWQILSKFLDSHIFLDIYSPVILEQLKKDYSRYDQGVSYLGVPIENVWQKDFKNTGEELPFVDKALTLIIKEAY